MLGQTSPFFQLLLWGWIWLVVIAGYLAFKECYTIWKHSKVHVGRMVLILSMVVVAVTWYNLQLRIVGQIDGEIVSTNGRRARVKVYGRGHHSLVFDGIRSEFGGLGRPREIFWMRDGTTIGVRYQFENEAWRMIEVDLYDRFYSGQSLTEQERERLDYTKDRILPEEIAELDAARRQAEQRGSIWKNRRIGESGDFED